MTTPRERINLIGSAVWMLTPLTGNYQVSVSDYAYWMGRAADRINETTALADGWDWMDAYVDWLRVNPVICSRIRYLPEIEN